jgi:HEAT repeat protein
VLLFGPSARNAIAAVTTQVKRINDISPQATALIALAELVPLLPPTPQGATPDPRITNAVNAIIGVMDSPEAVIRFRAATALGWIGPPASAAVQKLREHVMDRQSWEIRKAVCFALGRVGRDQFGSPSVLALEALANGVADRESKAVRLEALQSVLVLGAPNPPTPLRLMDVLRQRAAGAEKDKCLLIWVRVAIMALDAGQINDKNVAVVAKEMKNSDADIRLTAIKAVGVMGPRAKEYVQDLIDFLPKATEPVMMVELCGALARMGQYAERAIPSLETMQTKDNPVVKEAAKMAVDAIKKAIDQAKQQPVVPKK